MATEFLLPTKYIGEDYGISVVIFGLDDNITYDKFIIYLEDDKENAVEVFRDENDELETTSATFNGLHIGGYYTVSAEITYGETTKVISNKIPVSTNKAEDGVTLFGSETRMNGLSVSTNVNTNTDKSIISTYSVSRSYTNIEPIYTSIKDQGSYGTCVACASTTAMSVLRYKCASVYEDYSISYIYGSDYGNEEGMFYEDVVYVCINEGSPRWEIATDNLNGWNYKESAIELYERVNENPIAKKNAENQKIKKFITVNFYNVNELAGYIDTYGCAIIQVRLTETIRKGNFTSGIIPDPRTEEPLDDSHAMVIIGLKQINNKPHWIVQNSYGTDWGNGGIGFMPFDWGDSEWILSTSVLIPGEGYYLPQPSAPTFCDKPSHIYYNGGFDSKTVNVQYELTPSSNNVKALVLASPDGRTFWQKETVDHIGKSGTNIKNGVNVSVQNYGNFDFMLLVIDENY